MAKWVPPDSDRRQSRRFFPGDGEHRSGGDRRHRSLVWIAHLHHQCTHFAAVHESGPGTHSPFAARPMAASPRQRTNSLLRFCCKVVHRIETGLERKDEREGPNRTEQRACRHGVSGCGSRTNSFVHWDDSLRNCCHPCDLLEPSEVISAARSVSSLGLPT